MRKLKGLVLIALFATTACEPLTAASYSPELIGGKIEEQGLFPEVVYIRSGNARCSATVIGKSVILTAAHCVKDHGDVGPVILPSPANQAHEVYFKVGDEHFTAKCWQTPMYRDHKGDHDFALCKTDHPIKIKPASISKQGPSVGDMVLLSGFGCVGSDGLGGNNGALKIGKVQVTKLPEGSNYWFETEGDVALCFGDSGGPAFLDEDSHQIIGVNSQGDIKSISLMTALWIPESVKFMKDFAKAKKVAICGITEEC